MGYPSGSPVPPMQLLPRNAWSHLRELQLLPSTLEPCCKEDSYRSSGNWMQTLNQMISLPPPTSSRVLTLLAWQATLYWIWNERNSRLHANLFRPVDSLFKQIDGQVRNKIQSFRESSPILSPQMIQQWFTHQWCEDLIGASTLRFSPVTTPPPPFPSNQQLPLLGFNN